LSGYKQAMAHGVTLSTRKFSFAGEAFSLDSAVAARPAMAKSAYRGWKAAPTEKDPTYLERLN
jgi:hypothetical protein